MRHISDFTNVTCLSDVREDKVEKTTLDQACAQLVDQIFIKFGLLCREYDALYADTRRENAEKLQWTLAFTKHNIKTKSQVQYALNQTEEHKWGKPPQLGLFLSWCKPTMETLGFPSVDEAYVISIRMNVQFSDYRHNDERVDAVIRHALHQIGTTAYREMKSESAKKTFKTYYEIALKQFIEGELQVILKALPEKAQAHPSDRKRSDEARQRAMDALRGFGINVKRTDERTMQENPV